MGGMAPLAEKLFRVWKNRPLTDSVGSPSGSWLFNGRFTIPLCAGSFSGGFGDSGVSRAGWAGKHLSELVGKHPNETVRNVGPAMIAT
jgi:hypothetical protein